jgi:hypothetical protein
MKILVQLRGAEKAVPSGAYNPLRSTTPLVNPRTSSQLLGGLAPLLLCLGATVQGVAQPTITRQPANLSLSIGATATFRVTAASTNGPITYQWRHVDTPLLNATTAVLTLTNIQLIDAGAYLVAVTDASGTTNSAPAVLDVDPTWTKITSDPIVTSSGNVATGAWADYDDDGFFDLLQIRVTAPGPNPLYRNKGDGSFTRVMEPSLQALLANDGVYCWGDYDNDGYPDLFVPEGHGLGLKNLLYHNNGDGTFMRVTNSPIAQETGYSSGGAWGDFDRDGWLDLCVANGSAGPFPGGPSEPPQRNSFYQNEGEGTFTRLTNGLVRPIVTEPGYYDIPIWTDADNDGWQDLFIVSTDGYNRLYRNTGAGGFVKVTGDPLVIEYDVHWGDAAWADYNNDGAPDVFLTTARASVGLPGFGPVALFRNDGPGHFTKMTTNDVGPLAAERTDTYVCCWGDYDNDGWLDLYIAANSSIAAAENRTDLLYHNNGDGTFTKVTRGSPVNELGASFGGWLVDLNNDGFLDLVALQALAPDDGRVRYYRNNGNSNAWLCVKCVGTASPRLGTGAKVRVKAMIRGNPIWQVRVIDPGGFANAQNFIAHFGLGDATNVDVLHIEWTSGTIQELKNVSVNQYLTVTEPVKLSMPQPGEVHIQCWKGMAYRIEASPDLLSWTPMVTVTNLSGTLQWTDPDGPGRGTRFYRAAKQ